jgi:branched-chain amino acid transport system ATP-binding protein
LDHVKKLLALRKLESGSWRRPVSFELQTGEIVLLLGRNSSGKTTLLNTIAGLLPVRLGQVLIEGRDVSDLDTIGRTRSGVRLALEGRQVFGRLSVKRNLLLGAYGSGTDHEVKKDLEWVLDTFPDLRDKLDALAWSLSGGQQTMLNIGRALMGGPKLLLMDEPTLGLDPQNTRNLINALEQIRRERQVGILVAEQSGLFARAFPERVILIVGGEILFDGPWEQANREGKLTEIFA